MSGTPEGYLKGHKKRMSKDPDYRSKIAAMGGAASNNRPFRDDPSLAKKASLKGVEARRKKALDTETNHD